MDKLYSSKDKNQNRNHENTYFFWELILVKKNSKKDCKNNSKSNSKNERITDKIFKNHGPTLNNYKNNENEIPLMKYINKNLLLGNKENKSKIPNLLSLNNHRHRFESNNNINNINLNYIPKNIKNII